MITHSRNFGSQMAFTSGMQQAVGDAVILTCGATWLLALGFPPANAFMLGVVPFLLWDAVKVAVAATSYRLLVGRVQ